MKDLEELLDKWQTKLYNDVQSGAAQSYAYPAITKYLMIESQEYLYILQKVAKLDAPSTKVDFRNSNTVSKAKPSGDAGDKSKSPTKKQPAIASWESLGVKNEVAWEEFKLFFTNYIAYNSNVIELLLSLATLKSFPM